MPTRALNLPGAISPGTLSVFSSPPFQELLPLVNIPRYDYVNFQLRSLAYGDDRKGDLTDWVRFFVSELICFQIGPRNTMTSSF